MVWRQTGAWYFYPRPPRGGRLSDKPASWHSCDRFLSTPSARRATHPCPACRKTGPISIHALREEGDGIFGEGTENALLFLSTPSARRATLWNVVEVFTYMISIHALREEGDRAGSVRGMTVNLFLSTPSARRATWLALSICGFSTDFYPRPPRGGRHGTAAVHLYTVEFLSTPSARRATVYIAGWRIAVRISIHALREEGDSRYVLGLSAFWQFLSTPSARRATAKTETKSLFSYKLYNILHEFRRALIYNGSKNYPNHAK